jgi:hypothetical protein
MVPNNFEKLYLDPIEELDDILDHTWRTLCDYYDAGGELPDIQSLFYRADVTTPGQAAEIVIANMLLEVVDGISRFSPWYTKPARAFGLRAIRETITKCTRWRLAPEAIQKWQALIEPLADSIRQNSGAIQAMLYVESLMGSLHYQDECVTARCNCQPPHIIRLKKSALDGMKIYCSVCGQPFA